MTMKYFVAFKINGTWTADLNFKRDLFSDAPLDESLDTGIVVDVPAALRKIPPYTLCRITTVDAETDEIVETQYFLTADREAEAVTLFRSA